MPGTVPSVISQAPEVMLTMAPPPASRIPGTSILAKRKGAVRFTVSWRIQLARDSWSRFWYIGRPRKAALLTRTSTRPRQAAASSAKADDGFGVGQVGPHGQGFAAYGVDLGHRLGQRAGHRAAGIEGAGGHHHGDPTTGQLDRGGLPDAAAGPGDQGDLSLELHAHASVSVPTGGRGSVRSGGSGWRYSAAAFLNVMRSASTLGTPASWAATIDCVLGQDESVWGSRSRT